MTPVPAGAQRDPRVLWRRTLDGCVLLAPVGDPICLNTSAAAVWMLLGRWRTSDDLVAALAGAWNAPGELIARDVETLLGELVTEGLADDTPP